MKYKATEGSRRRFPVYWLLWWCRVGNDRIVGEASDFRLAGDDFTIYFICLREDPQICPCSSWVRNWHGKSGDVELSCLIARCFRRWSLRISLWCFDLKKKESKEIWRVRLPFNIGGSLGIRLLPFQDMKDLTAENSIYYRSHKDLYFYFSILIVILSYLFHLLIVRFFPFPLQVHLLKIFIKSHFFY